MILRPHRIPPLHDRGPGTCHMAAVDRPQLKVRPLVPEKSYRRRPRPNDLRRRGNLVGVKERCRLCRVANRPGAERAFQHDHAGGSSMK